MTNQQQIMTFYVGNMLFGIDVEQVLLLGQGIDAIDPLPVEEQGLVGMIKLESIAIPVIDFARRFGIRSSNDKKAALLTQVETVHQGYQDWLQEIQWQLTARHKIDHSVMKKNVKLLSWNNNIQLDDNKLQSLLNTLDDPKSTLKFCLEQLITLTYDQQWQQAELVFKQQRTVISKQFEQILNRAHQCLNVKARPVLLYLTENGRTPAYALLVDHINDVLSYPQSGFQSCETGPMQAIEEIKRDISGVYISEGMPNCFYVSLDNLQSLQKPSSVPKA